MEHPNRKKIGEFSPSSSKPKATAIGSLKSPNSFVSPPKKSSSSKGAKYFERKKPLSIKKLKEEFEDVTRG